MPAPMASSQWSYFMYDAYEAWPGRGVRLVDLVLLDVLEVPVEVGDQDHERRAVGVTRRC